MDIEDSCERNPQSPQQQSYHITDYFMPVTPSQAISDVITLLLWTLRIPMRGILKVHSNKDSYERNPQSPQQQSYHITDYFMPVTPSQAISDVITSLLWTLRIPVRGILKVHSNKVITSLIAWDGVTGIKIPVRGILKVHSNEVITSLIAWDGVTGIKIPVRGILKVHSNKVITSLIAWDGVTGIKIPVRGILKVHSNKVITSLIAWDGVTGIKIPVRGILNVHGNEIEDFYESGQYLATQGGLGNVMTSLLWTLRIPVRVSCYMERLSDVMTLSLWMLRIPMRGLVISKHLDCRGSRYGRSSYYKHNVFSSGVEVLMVQLLTVAKTVRRALNKSLQELAEKVRLYVIVKDQIIKQLGHRGHPLVPVLH
ncbi:hypothetical protein EDD22DRAFT_852441 [Suillus occidentalis]|nr:hypothetical protein EDD22DRAFT_852441 [Suillus occidentalis]